MSSSRRIFKPYGSGRPPSALNNISISNDNIISTFGPRSNISFNKSNNNGEIRKLNTLSSNVTESLNTYLPRSNIKDKDDKKDKLLDNKQRSSTATPIIEIDSSMNLQSALTQRRNEIVFAQATTNEFEQVIQPYMLYRPITYHAPVAKLLEGENSIMKLIPSSLSTYILYLDFFAYFPTPNIGAYSTVTSLISFLSTILYLFIIGVFLGYTTYLYIRHEPYSVGTLDYATSTTTQYNFDIYAQVLVDDSPYDLTNTTYLNVSFINSVMYGSDTSNPTLYRTSLPFTLCSNSNITFTAADDYQVNSFCAYNTVKPTIQAWFFNSVYRYFSIQVSIGSACDSINSTQTVNCLTSEPFSSIWNNIKLVVYIPITTSKSFSVQKFAQTYVEGWSSTSQIVLSPLSYIDYNTVYIPLAQYPSTVSWLNVERFTSRNSVNFGAYYNRVLNFDFVLSSSSTKSTFRYSSLGDLFAQWGGFLAIVTIFFSVVVIFNTLKFYYYFTWDIEPFTRGKEKSIATAYRALDAKLVPVSQRGEPLIIKHKEYDPPLVRRKKEIDAEIKAAGLASRSIV